MTYINGIPVAPDELLPVERALLARLRTGRVTRTNWHLDVTVAGRGPTRVVAIRIRPTPRGRLTRLPRLAYLLTQVLKAGASS